MDSDAEWVGVDYEFGSRNPTTTRAPRPRPRPGPAPRPATERPVNPAPRPPIGQGPHDAADRSTPNGGADASNIGLIAGLIGGVLGAVLLVLLVYMLVLRRRLNKAKVMKSDSDYRIRVEDVAHLTNLDETSNTYVNTTDLQKLVSSVRAKKKTEERIPTPPRVQHQTPAPYRPPPVTNAKPCTTPATNGSNTCFQGDNDVVVLRAPMPLPHSANHPPLNNVWSNNLSSPESEAVYSNVDVENTSSPLPPQGLRSKVSAPKIAPPPPPVKSAKPGSSDAVGNSTVIARPAPPPPTKARSSDEIQSPPVTNVNAFSSSPVQKPQPPTGNAKPAPPVAQKPKKPQEDEPDLSKETASSIPSKPVPPTAPKPNGVLSKGRGLPPLKMALLPPSFSKSSFDSCASTPDTVIMELTPDSTPTLDPGREGGGTAGSAGKSIGAKIAFLEGKMRTPAKPSRAFPPKS